MEQLCQRFGYGRWNGFCISSCKPTTMAKKTNPDKPEVPKPESPEITPEIVPNDPTGPFEEPEIIPEDDPGGTSPGEIPVPEPNEEPGKQDEPGEPK
jgi:hypothetical protein